MKYILFYSLFIFGSGITYGQQPSTSEQEIQQLIIDSFEEIWSGWSPAKIPGFYTEDFLLLEAGEVWDNEKIAQTLERATSNGKQTPVRTNSFDFIEVKLSGNTAWIAYHNYAEFNVDGQVTRKMHWLESATAIKTAAGWRLDMLHSTPVK